MILILSILLINISLAELIQPENEKNINYTHVLFEWTQEENAHSYNIEIDISEAFNSSSFCLLYTSDAADE